MSKGGEEHREQKQRLWSQMMTVATSTTTTRQRLDELPVVLRLLAHLHLHVQPALRAPKKKKKRMTEVPQQGVGAEQKSHLQYRCCYHHHYYYC